MINAILAIFTVAAAMGQEVPELVQPFKSVDACLIEAAKQNTEHRKELAEAGAAFACLVVKLPTI